MVLTLSRVLSVVVVAALGRSIHAGRELDNFVIAVGLGHYGLSLVYARHRIAEVVRDARSAGLLLAAIMAAAAGVFSGAAIAPIFGFHHIINEAYAAPKNKERRPSPALGLSLLLHTLVYLCLYKVRIVNSGPVFWACFAMSWPVFVAYLAFALKETAEDRIERISAEVLAMTVLVVSFWVPVNMFNLVMYHFAFWTFFPMLTMPRMRAAQLGLATVVATALAFAVSPLSPLPMTMSARVYFSVFGFATYLHTTTSLALSRVNPSFVTQWFSPRPARAKPSPLPA